jgi:PKD repeat protein
LDNINITGVSSIKPTANFISDTAECANTTLAFYDISQDMPSSWEWTFTGGTPATSSLQNPLVSYAAPGTYPVKLKATNSIGSDSIVKMSYITIEPVKQVGISIAATNASICFSDTAEFTATVINGGLFPNYQWQLNGNNVGGNFSFVKLLNLTSADVVTCILKSSENCASDTALLSNSVSISVLPLPQVSMPGLASECSNGSPVTLTGGSPAGGAYSGDGVSNGVFDPLVAGTGSHWITYTYTNAAGCSNSDRKSVFVFNTPLKPVVIAPVTNTLKCSQNFNSYQWLDGSGNDIVGETNQTFNPTSNGTFSVRIMDGNGCFNVSDPYEVNNISIEEYLQSSFNIFPNPTKGIVNISLNSQTQEKGTVEIYNAIGELIYAQDIQLNSGENTFQIDVNSFASGMYSVKLSIDDAYALKQLIKL